MSFNAIRENKILAKISESTVNDRGKGRMMRTHQPRSAKSALLRHLTPYPALDVDCHFVQNVRR